MDEQIAWLERVKIRALAAQLERYENGKGDVAAKEVERLREVLAEYRAIVEEFRNRPPKD
ncbi:MAG: hypothetical protein ACLP8A_10080 [Methylovirgula sp.]